MQSEKKLVQTSEKIIYELLFKVFSGEYSGIALNEVLKKTIKDKQYITRVFYGVLEKNVQLDFIIGELTATRPKKPALIILKIGLYLLRFSNTPKHSAIDKTVSVAKQIGKKDLSGFINAVLRKSLDYVVQTSDLAINLSVPGWIIKLLQKHYDDEFIKKMFDTTEYRTHIRSNKVLFDKTELGYLATKAQLDSLNKNDYTIMSLSSMLAVKNYISGFDKNDKLNVLDLCAAPGGKAVYLKELLPNARVVACDIHAHRLELIKAYANTRGVDIQILQNDATIFNAKWQNKFDLVICDVPCSGLGVRQKPDVFINRKPEDIAVLNKLQLDILQNGSKYVALNGTLCYSTCTILKEENEEIIEKFLALNKDFGLIEWQNLYPQNHNSDGFFIAKTLRKHMFGHN